MGTPPFLPNLSLLQYAADKLFASHHFSKGILFLFPFLFFKGKLFPCRLSCKEACPFVLQGFRTALQRHRRYRTPGPATIRASVPASTTSTLRKILRAGIFNHNGRKAISRKISGATVCPSITVSINFHSFISIPEASQGNRTFPFLITPQQSPYAWLICFPFTICCSWTRSE
jgi:hypothetical protein